MLAGLATLTACTNASEATTATTTNTTTNTTTESVVNESNDDARPTTTATTTTATTESLPDEATTACEERVVLDEYGFPVEFELCGDDGEGEGDATMSASAILSRVPSDGARAALDAGHESATRLGASCGDADWTLQADRLFSGLDATIELVRSDAGLVDWVGGTDARALADEFRDLLIFPTGCADSTAAVDASDPAVVIETAGRLSGINDDMTFALTAPEQILFGSDFWYATDQVGHLVDTALFLGAEPIDVLLMGPSTVKRGVDPVQLRTAIGRPTYNAAVGALSPDLQLSWYLELRAAGVDAKTVVIGLNTWIDLLPCEAPQMERVEETDARRARAFEGISALSDLSPGQRLVGGEQPSYSGRVLQTHRETWLPGTGGRFELFDEYQPEVADTQIERYGALPYEGLCPDRLARIAALAEAALADGSQVVLLVLPTSDAMASLHPDGRAGHDVVVDEYRRIAEETGADLVDTSDLVDDDLYVDLTHVGNAGRALITDALAPALTGAGSSTP